MIYVTKHCDVEPTRVIIPFEIEKVLEPDKCCVPSLEEMALRRVGSLLRTWPGIVLEQDACFVPSLENLNCTKKMRKLNVWQIVTTMLRHNILADATLLQKY